MNKPENKLNKKAAGIIILAGAVLLIEAAALVYIIRLRTAGETAESAMPAQPEVISAEITPKPVITPEPVDYSFEAASLSVTEAMAKNTATVQAQDGSFPDWIELHNSSDKEIPLDGWCLSDGGGYWKFEDMSIAPDEYLLVWAGASGGLTTDFSLSAGETVYLLDPNGKAVSELSLERLDSDESAVSSFKDDGIMLVTPGFENSVEGYKEYIKTEKAPLGPVIISEVCTANSKSGLFIKNSYRDWVELRNISDETVNLSDYYISDKNSNHLLFRIPEYSLKAGEYVVIYCDSDFDGTENGSGYLCAPFSLSSESEHVFLSNQSEELIDYIAFHNMPVNGSFGRMDGADGNLYFEEPSPGKVNSDGKLYVACSPVSSTPSGQYDGVESITVELSDPSGRGQVYYTLGGDVSKNSLTLYTEPLVLTETSILRAVTYEDEGCRSRLATFSFFINEGHTMPVVSLVGENFAEFNTFNFSENKFIECGGNVAMYEGDSEVFSKSCAIRLKGFTAVLDPMKKNYGVYFTDRYGSSDIEGLDLFNNGITEYSSLLLRAGQDWSFQGSCVRHEMMETLCHEFSPEMPTQSNIYCVLYINGQYRGIYSIKQDMNNKFFADWLGVSKDSVTSVRANPEYDTPLYYAFEFFRKNDMTDSEKYAEACELFDMDNVIDFIFLQSYGGNTDMYNNVKTFSSTEGDGLWRFAFYDQDLTFYNNYGAVNDVFTGFAKPFQYLTDMAKALCRNDEFRDRLLKRFAEGLTGSFSDSHVLETIDNLCSQLSPEIERDRARYNMTVDEWQAYVGLLRKFFENGYAANVAGNLSDILGLSGAEREQYFSGILG